MKQYIDKAAVVAELERLYNLEYDNTSNLSCGKKIMLRNILLFLNTLEVKEVDLEEEIDKWYNNEASKEFENVLYEDIEKCARHFFELGLNASKEA